MRNLNQPIRYMLRMSGEPPRFITVEDNKSIIGEAPATYQSITLSTPNLTGRINAIVDSAEAELAAITSPLRPLRSVVAMAALQAKLGKDLLASKAAAAAERLHEKEFALWAAWFRRQGWVAFGEYPTVWEVIAERERLDNLQYNGRPPF